VKTATAFSPCNITGFFRIYDHIGDLLRVGSTGAGVALSLGVRTRVTVKKARKTHVLATFNGQTLPWTSVSSHVAMKYLDLDRNPWLVNIAHQTQLPVGCGYGTSGAGALSLSLALNETMGSPLGTLEAAQLAHVSEIMCGTGLGTVSSVFCGGFNLRTLAGAPGIGQVKRIEMPRSLRILTASFGPISTRRVLGSRLLRGRINQCAKNSIRRFSETPTNASFMRVSRLFSDCLGLVSNRLSRLIDRLDTFGARSSMVMLGESVFTIADEDQISALSASVKREGLTPRVTAVAQSGARLI
jgi:pantoate kinase